MGIKEIYPYLPEGIVSELSKIPAHDDICEIRMRSEKAVAVTIGGVQKSLSRSVTAGEVESAFNAVCRQSVHSYAREISEGFVVLRGGHRVGLCGTAVISSDGIETVRYISGLNFRVCTERKGSADVIVKRVFSGKPVSVLIAGAPLSAKTTVLRDLCRQLGNRTGVCVIDERGEIAAAYKGVSSNDVGRFTDVFNGYPRYDGMTTALRVMSPEYIAVDEIGTEKDADAIMSCMHGGAHIIATAHAESTDELYRRPQIKRLIENGVFSYIIFLGNRENIGRVMEIREVRI